MLTVVYACQLRGLTYADVLCGFASCMDLDCVGFLRGMLARPAAACALSFMFLCALMWALTLSCTMCVCGTW